MRGLLENAPYSVISFVEICELIVCRKERVIFKRKIRNYTYQTLEKQALEIQISALFLVYWST